MAEAGESVQTFNVIDPAGIGILEDAGFEAGPDATDPAAIILRSHELQAEEVADGVDLVVRAGAGINNVPIDELTQRGVVVENTPGQNALSVAELVMAGLLVASRNLDQVFLRTASMTEEDLTTVEADKKRFAGSEIAGRRLAVIGLGSIGLITAIRGRSMGMDVVGHDKYLKDGSVKRLNEAGVDLVEHPEEALEVGDFVTIHVPLLETTRGMVNADMIAAMKHGAVLLNFARGELVVPSDVTAALDAGQLYKHVTDFPEKEFLGREDVIMTPHLGASTDNAERNCATAAARQVRDFIKDGTIKNSVNFPDVELKRNQDGGARVLVLHGDETGMLHEITGEIVHRGLNIAGIENGRRKATEGTGAAATLFDVDEQPGQDVADLAEHIAGLNGVVKVIDVDGRK